jgi:hypothetical protein
MKTTSLENDIKVFYVTAESYPEGILAAHQKLHAKVPFSYDRKYFGLSRPENNKGIIYKAATEETFDGEAEQYNLESLIIPKGNYYSLIISNYRNDIPSIGKTFQKLLSQENIDQNGYCIEWYINENDVNCLVRKADII